LLLTHTFTSPELPSATGSTFFDLEFFGLVTHPDLFDRHLNHWANLFLSHNFNAVGEEINAIFLQKLNTQSIAALISKKSNPVRNTLISHQQASTFTKTKYNPNTITISTSSITQNMFLPTNPTRGIEATSSSIALTMDTTPTQHHHG